MEKKLFFKDQTSNVNDSNTLKGLESEAGNGSVYRFCVFRHPYNNTRYVYIYRYIFRIINLVGPFTQTIISINLYWFRACSECQKSTDSANTSFSWSREDKNKLLHEDADSDMYFCHKHLHNGSTRLFYKSQKYFKLKYVKWLLKLMSALLYILICRMFSGNNRVRTLIYDCYFEFYGLS